MQALSTSSRTHGVARQAARRVSSVCTVRPQRASRACAARIVAAFSPPTVGETKNKFLGGYPLPVPAIYEAVVQELLVQMHFVRFSTNYSYNKIYALGFVSVFDQILEAIDEGERNKIFSAYIRALDESPEQFRKDAETIEQLASSMGSPDSLTPDASGNDLQQALASLTERAAAGKLQYNKFIAIGLFRLLELTGAKEPAALERLVKSVGIKPEAVNRDLLLYKGILSKLSAAKELMREINEREKRKQAEREAEKAAKLQKAEATVQA